LLLLLHVLQLLETVQVRGLLLLQVRHQAYVFGTTIPLDQVVELLLVGAPTLLQSLLVVLFHFVLESYHLLALDVREFDVFSGLQDFE